MGTCAILLKTGQKGWSGLPAKKKYTPKQLRVAIEEYFESITYIQPVQKLTDTGRVNSKGMPVMKYENVINERGEVIMERVYAVPPSVEGLCLCLGISRQTLHNWRNDTELGEKYIEVIDAAKLRIEAYLHGELNRRPKVAGIIFDLQCNYGWGGEKNDSGARKIEVSYVPLEETGEESEYSQ